MRDLINNKLFWTLIILIIVISCVQEKNDVYKITPKNSLLTLEVIKQSEGIYKINNSIVLLYELKDKELDRLGNYHLLFYNNQKRLISGCYFFSENIYYYKNDSIIAYQNEHRLQRNGVFVNDIPVGIKINYKKYSVQQPSSRFINRGTIERLNYNKQKETVNFKIKDSVSKFEDISLYKITFNYKDEKISINNTLDDKTRETIVFKIKKQQLDDFFKSIID